MVVVVIIAVLAVIAVPLFAQRFRQARVLQGAQTIAELYRGARARALGRGAAIVVTLTPSATAGQGTVDVLEGVQGTAASINAEEAECDNRPTRGCLANNWTPLVGANVGTSRVVTNAVVPYDVVTTASWGPGTPVNAGTGLSVCFSPGGRAFVNPSGVWAPASWQPFNAPLVIDVAGQGRTHRVVVLPNGTARLGL